MYDIYQIKLNDTIESLANRYGTTIEELRRLNPNSSFGVGSNIIVPTTKEYFEVYTIEKGDNLYNIARKYNTDYNLLALLNGLNVNDYIYIIKENENITLSLENMFYNKKINYTYDEYLEHLKLTKKFEKENINYHLNYEKEQTFKNITTTITNNKYVIISKIANPAIHFVIKHPKLVEAIDNFNPLVKE